MATKLFSDSARHTTLASGISGGAASITVADATGWPSPSAGQEANVAVDYGDQALVEVGTYTSRSGNVLSGVTGIASAHSAGVEVWHVHSAADASRGANVPAHAIAYKSADESVTSSTTIQDDNGLFLPLGANEIWLFTAVILYSGATAGDIRVAFSVPAGATLNWSAPGAPTVADAYAVATDNETFTNAYGATGAKTVLLGVGRVANGGTPGNLQFRFAQQVSNATPTTVYAGSHVIAHRVP